MSTNQSMQIFSIISQIEQVVENSPRPKLGGNTKRVVDVDEIYDLLGDLKVTIPEDIRRANSVLIEADNIVAHAEDHAGELVAEAQAHAESIIAEAQEQAAAIAAEAERQFEERLSENEIIAEAQRRAVALANMAETNANIVYEGAKQYADDILSDLQRFLVQYQTLVAENRAELGVRSKEEQQAEAAEQAAEQSSLRKKAQAAASDEDFEEEEDFAPRKSIFDSLFKRKRRDDDYEEDFEEEEELEAGADEE